MSVWHALWVPKGTPHDVIAKLNAAAREALADPAVRKQLQDLGQEIPPVDQQSPEALRAHHKAEIDKWWPIIKAAGIKSVERCPSQPISKSIASTGSITTVLRTRRPKRAPKWVRSPVTRRWQCDSTAAARMGASFGGSRCARAHATVAGDGSRDNDNRPTSFSRSPARLGCLARTFLRASSIAYPEDTSSHAPASASAKKARTEPVSRYAALNSTFASRKTRIAQRLARFFLR